MTGHAFDRRYDLGARPAGPVFVPPGQGGAPPRPAPARAVPTRVRPAPPPPPTAPPVPNPLAVPAAPRGSRGSGALLVSACLLIGAAAGGGAGYLVADTARTPPLRQSAPAVSGPAGPGDTRSASQALLPSVVQINAGNGSGSGFALDDQGRVMTNSHVIGDSSRVLIRMADGRRSAAEVIGSDPATDVAVVEVSGPPPPAAALGISSGLAIGEPVIAVGAPLGLNSTVTAGIISAVGRTARLGPYPEQELLQTDASINPGNSGGPLANLEGQVVGMNTAIATVGGPEAGNIGIGFAVPIDRAVEVAREIIENG